MVSAAVKYHFVRESRGLTAVRRPGLEMSGGKMACPVCSFVICAFVWFDLPVERGDYECSVFR